MSKDIHNIIIDTDIGDDIDDTFALLFAIKSPEIHVEGITTVFRNAQRRAKMCKTVLQTYGIEDIPVYAGIDQPIIEEIHEQGNDRYDENRRFYPCQYSNMMESISFNHELHAVDYIIDTIRKRPGCIEIVPIGPLTNIAFAIRKAPDIITKIKGITLMGGYFTSKVPEWNILCDPEAARIVFTSGIDVKAVGLDVTLKCRLLIEQLEDFKKSDNKTSRLVNEMMQKWLDHYRFECPVLHDPLTIGTLIDDSFVSFEKKYVKVITDGEMRGITVQQENAEDYGTSVISVATNVNQKQYMEFFKSRVLGK